jgi:hypothetical protein
MIQVLFEVHYRLNSQGFILMSTLVGTGDLLSLRQGQLSVDFRLNLG